MTGRFKICLIDDDKVFGEVLRVAASDFHVEFDFYESLEDLGRVAQLAKYDLLICDFFLETFTGQEIAEYVRAFFDGVPIVMISADDRVGDSLERWPACVRGFISKRLAPTQIIKRSIELSHLSSADNRSFEKTHRKEKGHYDRYKNP